MVIRLVFFFVSTIWTVKYRTKTQILISLSLCYYLFQSIFLRASCLTALFSIVLYDDVKKHLPEKGVICGAISERRILKTRGQCKEYFEIIPLHCYIITLIRFALRLMIQIRKTNQIFQISGKQTKFSVTNYAVMHLCIIISALLYLLHFLS